MIGRLRGAVIECEEGRVVVDAGGVGFEVTVPKPLAVKHSVPDSRADLYVFTHFHERGAALYGFESRAEREVFKRLLGVSKVGPAVAMAVLSHLDLPALARAVAEEDVAALVRVPGVGKKTAERLVMELKDVLADYVELAAGTGPAPIARNEALEDVRSALVQMGFRASQVNGIMAELDRRTEPGQSFEELLKEALRLLTRP